MANPNVFQQYLQAPRSVLDYQNEMDTADYRRAQLQGQQSQNALMSLGLQQKMRADQRSQEVQNAIQRAASISKTPEELITNLRGLGTPEAFTQADSLEKGMIERQKGAAEAAKNTTEAQQKKAGMMKELAGIILASPSATTVQAVLSHYSNITGDPTDKVAQVFAQANGDPEAIKRIAAGFSMQADKLLPKIDTVNTGGAQVTQAIDPLTGKPTVTGRIQNTQSPDNAATVAATMRGQNMTDARQREMNIIQREANTTQIVNDPERGVLLVNKGTKTAVPAMDANGNPLSGESAIKRQNAAGRTLPILDEADKLIEQATGSYVGAGVDLAGRAIGQSTAGADAIAKLKVLEGNLMMAQPRMEGPQSDKDTLLYRQMAGQIGDPTVPKDMKKAALQTIRQIQEKYAAGQQAPASSGGFKIIKVE